MKRRSISIFLGSGVSVPSGLPSVTQITQELLKGKGVSYLNHKQKQSSDLKKVQGLLNKLEEIDRHYMDNIARYWSKGQYLSTGYIYRNITTYEDLFYLTEQIIDSEKGLLDDATAGAFVDLVEKKARSILKGKTINERIISLYHLAIEASNFIQWIVANSLHTHNIQGLDLIVEIARHSSIKKLDIITLNHDTLVEQVLSQNNIPFADGFGKADGDVRWYDDTVYDDKKTKVRIFKPHGSINWFSFLVKGRLHPASVSCADPTQIRDSNGKLLKSHFTTPSFLSGTNKVVLYNEGIYAKMFYRIYQSLRKSNFMLMSGYGWGDVPINFRLVDWINSSNQNSITLLHQKPADLINRSLLLAENYNSWLQSGQFIPISKWLCDTSLNDIGL